MTIYGSCERCLGETRQYVCSTCLTTERDELLALIGWMVWRHLDDAPLVSECRQRLAERGHKLLVENQ